MIWANRQAKSAHGSKVGQSEPFEDDVTKKLKELKEQNKQFRANTTRPNNSCGFINFGMIYWIVLMVLCL